MVQDGQPFGYLVALNTEKRYVSLLNWMAETVVARLADVQAMQDMTDELISAWDQLELIYRVTENLALTTDLPEILQSILREIKKVTHTADGFILIRKSDSFLCVSGQPDNNKTFCDVTLLNSLTRGQPCYLV